jgi:hypothetical protein
MRAFQEGVRRLGNAVNAVEAEFILLTSPPFDAAAIPGKAQPETVQDFGSSAPFVGYDSVLADYAKWEQSLSVDEAKVVVDLHTVLSTALAARRERDGAFVFAKDGIHPSPLGHLLMAHTFLRGIGVELETSADDLDAELARVETDPLFKLMHERREKRSAGWLNFVGYNRGKVVKSDSITEVESIACNLQKQIDEARRR